jgi:4-alpha-glucanotransferase
MADHHRPLSHSPEYERLLEAAARAAGMDDGYWDIWGHWHPTTHDVRRAILTSVGIDCDDEHQLRRAMEDRSHGDGDQLAPSTIVLNAADQPLAIDLLLPEEQAASELLVRIVCEDGQLHETTVHLAAVEALGSETRAGRLGKRKLITLPFTLPMGYHSAEFHVGTIRYASRLVLCPSKAWLPPSLAEGNPGAGLAVSLYGVRSRDTWGCDNFTSLRGIIDWVANRLGGSFVALNPLCAIHNRQPFNTSPYLPNSVYYRNFLYLDIARIPDFEKSSWAQALRNRPSVAAEIEALNRSEFVEYERVAAIKSAFLRLLFRSFLQRDYRPMTPRGVEFQRWVDAEGDLLDRFATFSALDEFHHRRNPEVWVWQDWPPEHHDPHSESVDRFRRAHPRAILFYKYVQWQLDRQAAEAQEYARQCGLSIGLFHDLPLATDRCGFDLWANPEFFVAGCRVGSPPDDFSPKGQDWSFPPPNTERHRSNGYRLFADSIRRSARHGGALRIDHVMRLFRLYWIPDGFDATRGTYVRDFHEDLLRILALESHRHQLLIVGEDLGTVEPYMRQALARFGILSYRLFYFERNEGGAFKLPGEYPVQALVSSTTHDLPTLAGFWAGRDIEARQTAGLVPEEGALQMRSQRESEKARMLDALVRAGFLPPEFPRTAASVPQLTGDLHNAIVGFIASTPCLLLTINHEDLTKEEHQQNLPGSTWQYPNWRRKMRFTVEELAESQQVADLVAMCRNWLQRTRRAAR